MWNTQIRFPIRKMIYFRVGWVWVFQIYFRLGPGLAGERYAHWTDGEGKGESSPRKAICQVCD